MIKFLSKSKKGFGLLEVLLAGLIIITMLGALVFVAKTAINNAAYTMERQNAIFLAQEGIEQVRQMRDTNYIDADSYTEWNMLTRNFSTNKYEAPDLNSKYYSYFGTTIGRLMLKQTSDIESIPDKTVGGVPYKRYFYFSKINDINTPAIGSVNDSLTMSDQILKVTVGVQWRAGEKEVILNEIIANIGEVVTR